MATTREIEIPARTVSKRWCWLQHKACLAANGYGDTLESLTPHALRLFSALGVDWQPGECLVAWVGIDDAVSYAFTVSHDDYQGWALSVSRIA